MNNIARRIITYICAFIVGFIISFKLSFVGVLVYAVYWGFRLRGNPADKIDVMTNSSGFAVCSTSLMLSSVGIALAFGFYLDRHTTLKRKGKKS